MPPRHQLSNSDTGGMAFPTLRAVPLPLGAPVTHLDLYSSSPAGALLGVTHVLGRLDAQQSPKLPAKGPADIGTSVTDQAKRLRRECEERPHPGSLTGRMQPWEAAFPLPLPRLLLLLLLLLFLLLFLPFPSPSLSLLLLFSKTNRSFASVSYGGWRVMCLSGTRVS